MKIGFCLPYMKNDYNRDTILEWCRRIDQGPFSSISCGERITGTAPTYDMRVLLSAAAAVTERVRLVPSLYVLPMHSAVRAAQEIATLDVLSNGRVTVTVGVGGRENDYRAVGASFKQRHQRMDEQIAEMRRIWAGEPPFPGADPVGPRPLQQSEQGGPPILAGVMGPKSMARVAKWADGIYAFSLNGEQHEIKHLLDMADNAWREAGRSTPPQRVGGFWYSLASKDADRKLKEYVRSYMNTAGDDIAKAVADTMTRSTPDAIKAAMDSLEALGCEELQLVPATTDFAEIDRIAEIVAKR